MEQPIYLDNAATTALDAEVLNAMLPYMQQHFGNPSSAYSLGRNVKSAIEEARKNIGTILGVKPSTLIFTSGGTESNNMAIAMAVNELRCTHIITSPIEHHAVLHTVEHYAHSRNITFSYVKLTESGEVDYANLEMQLSTQSKLGKKCLVTLMHANNEIGSLLDISLVGKLCKANDALFHSDCVQTIGHYPINLKECGVHFASATGHKFHGPKGTGLLYVSEEIKAYPLIFGGGQERKLRAGTENVSGIIGFAKALELATANYAQDSQYIAQLNQLMRKQLAAAVPGVSFNNPENSLYTVLSVCFPLSEQSDFLVTLFDMKGVCVSGGSACSSGDGGSHVMKAIGKAGACATLRFSFSKYTTEAEITRAVEITASLLQKKEVSAV
ncbi:cysteine desulfurase family protein [Pedobacter africanus]|uniref:cysteine desulfurase n=1 Tax=Pedobacter africanus TaxID=151894 RepID=A0A1W1ZSX9_9SPHI|nr:cysteine desulfurase family protein [Pedobacter africanus]SMC51484.1 cysteine desulfurase [Pedobacter africanus]